MPFRRIAVAMTACLCLSAFTAAAATGHTSHRPPDAKKGKTKSKAPRKAKKRTIATAARSDGRTKPILFVHGLDAFGSAGVDCGGTWNRMRDTLKAWGHSGAHQTIKYYHGDTNCTRALDGYGSHSSHYPRTDAHQYGSHDMDADIRHLGYHLAWLIYTEYSSKGITVDLVGHSMGGLVIRYMLDQNERNASGFPAYLYVEDVTTLGTPHAGSGYASWCGWAYECQQMSPGSSFMNYLASNAQHPDGDGGTDWTNVASYSDGVVSASSGTSMSADHKVRYLSSMGIGHSDYQHDVSDVRDADVEYNDYGGTWYSWYSAPHAVRWSDFALTYGSW